MAEDMRRHPGPPSVAAEEGENGRRTEQPRRLHRQPAQPVKTRGSSPVTGGVAPSVGQRRWSSVRSRFVLHARSRRVVIAHAWSAVLTCFHSCGGERYRRIVSFLQGRHRWSRSRSRSFRSSVIMVVGMLGGARAVCRAPGLAGDRVALRGSRPRHPGAGLAAVDLVRAAAVLERLGQWLAGFAPSIGQAIADIKLDPFTAAVIGFTVAYGAYMTEIFRAGIQSIAKGQMEAARSLGMNYIQAMRYIILPQAVRVILPPVGNEFVTLLKDSSLVSVLAVSDLTRRGREFVARTFLSFDTFTMVALIYLMLTLFFTRVFSAARAAR